MLKYQIWIVVLKFNKIENLTNIKNIKLQVYLKYNMLNIINGKSLNNLKMN